MALQDALHLLRQHQQQFEQQLQQWIAVVHQQAAMERQQVQAQTKQAEYDRQQAAAIAMATYQRQQAMAYQQQHHQQQQQQQAQLYFQRLVQMQSCHQQLQSQQQHPSQHQAAAQYGGYGAGGYYNGHPSYQPVYGRQMNYLVAPAVQHVQTQPASNSIAHLQNNALTYPQTPQPQQSMHGQGYYSGPATQYQFGQYGQQANGYANIHGAVPVHYPFNPNVNQYQPYLAGAQHATLHPQYNTSNVGQAVPGVHRSYAPQYSQPQHAGQVTAVSAPTADARVLAHNPNGIALAEVRRRQSPTVKLAQAKERALKVMVECKAIRAQRELASKPASPDVVKPVDVNRADQNPFVKPQPSSPNEAGHPSENDRQTVHVSTAEKNQRVVEWLKTRDVALRRRKRERSPSSPCPPSKRLKEEAASSPTHV